MPQPQQLPWNAQRTGEQANLFGEEVDIFKSARDRFGVWPTTVWECDLSNPLVQKLKAEIGDEATFRAHGPSYLSNSLGTNRKGYDVAANGTDPSTRAGSFTKPTDDDSVYRGKITASVFNPAVAQWLLNCYGPKPGATVFDPFAGGGTRAIVAAKSGYKYVGTELRQVEVDAVLKRCERVGARESVELHCIDAREASLVVEMWSAQFLYTCPPYYDLEQYEGGPDDLSMAGNYGAFLTMLGQVIAETKKVLELGSLSCWVSGLHRDTQGRLLAIPHDIARLHQQNGFEFVEEIVLAQKNNGAMQRIGMFDQGKHRLVRMHEYAGVFKYVG